MRRDYEDRKAQESDGTYTDSEQEDEEHTFQLSASYPLTDTINWITAFDYKIVDSNQAYEQFYNYDYDVYHLKSGVSVQF